MGSQIKSEWEGRFQAEESMSIGTQSFICGMLRNCMHSLEVSLSIQIDMSSVLLDES